MTTIGKSNVFDLISTSTLAENIRISLDCSDVVVVFILCVRVLLRCGSRIWKSFFSFSRNAFAVISIRARKSLTGGEESFFTTFLHTRPIAFRGRLRKMGSCSTNDNEWKLSTAHKSDDVTTSSSFPIAILFLFSDDDFFPSQKIQIQIENDHQRSVHAASVCEGITRGEVFPLARFLNFFSYFTFLLFSVLFFFMPASLFSAALCCCCFLLFLSTHISFFLCFLFCRANFNFSFFFFAFPSSPLVSLHTIFQEWTTVRGSCVSSPENMLKVLMHGGERNISSTLPVRDRPTEPKYMWILFEQLLICWAGRFNT